MKERPILFNGDMVSAILDGRKTQTRRVVRSKDFDQPAFNRRCSDIGVRAAIDEMATLPCPFGQLGDRLWVREAWSDLARDFYPHHQYEYRQAMPSLSRHVEDCRREASIDATCNRKHMPIEGCACGFRWKPSIHMPRRASRITLEVAGVRVDRLQNISEADAIAEGAPQRSTDDEDMCHRNGFIQLWCDINDVDSWLANPWVWVIEFKRVTP